MTKLEQMNELILKVQKDEALQKEIAAIMQNETAEDTAAADKWLADNGYEFTLMELVEHLEDGVPLSDEQLEAVAGGSKADSQKAVKLGLLVIGIGAAGGGIFCAAFKNK